MAKVGTKFCLILNKPTKTGPRLSKLGQSGIISPNLVTLIGRDNCAIATVKRGPICLSAQVLQRHLKIYIDRDCSGPTCAILFHPLAAAAASNFLSDYDFCFLFLPRFTLWLDNIWSVSHSTLLLHIFTF